MKKILFTAVLCGALFMTGCSYDDSDLRSSIDNIDTRLKALEEKVDGMNTEIGSLKTIVDALNSGKVITNVEEGTTGHTITFSDGRTITIKHGTDGSVGNQGTSPVIGVDKDGEVYYWTVTVGEIKEWLLDEEGNKIRVSGEDGQTGAAPLVGVDGDGYWTVDYGDGAQRILDGDGRPVRANAEDGDSFFKSVSVNEDEIEFTLSDDTTITVPRSGELAFTITANEQEAFLFGSVRDFPVVEKGVEQISISKPDGWKVSYADGNLTVEAPAKSNTWAEASGKISVVVVGSNATFIAEMKVQAAAYNYILTFEKADEGFLAGPTSYGANLYDGHAEQVFGYYDNDTDLMMPILDFYDDYNFYYGGVAVSRWNDMTTSSYTNQCSVYYADSETGFGGCNGSQTFAVSYGHGGRGGSGKRPEIYFLDDNTELAFDHFYVTNNTYAYLSMRDGDGFAKQFSYADGDWMRLNVEGFDKDEVSTGSVDFYLADFRDASASGVVEEWTKVDLSSLGKVHKLKFDITSSDNGTYGINTPAYFCFDDIALFME